LYSAASMLERKGSAANRLQLPRPHSSRRSANALTLGRWERHYNQAGSNGFKPMRGSDRGQPRILSRHTLNGTKALKRQQPLHSSDSIAKPRAWATHTTHPQADDCRPYPALLTGLARRDNGPTPD